MIIRRLNLYNFGVYAGQNEFKFHGDKPVVLIGGLNGRGKTTFLDAVLLSLYGSNSFAYKESKYKSYGQYLRSYVNMTDGSKKTRLSLEIQLDALDPERYIVEREWNAQEQRTHEKITVYKNGEYNKFLTDNWSMFIENILPSGLSNFFFFDGEKIAEIAVDKTDTHMKESIKTLLGISVLDSLESDLRRISNKNEEKGKLNINKDKLKLLRNEKEKADADLREADERICRFQEQLTQLEKKLESLREQYTAKGGDIISQKQELFATRSRLTEQIEQGRTELLEIASSELPLALVRPLLNEIRLQADKDYDIWTNQMAIKKIGDFVFNYTSENNGMSDELERFLEYVMAKGSEESSEPVYELSDMARYALNSLLEHQLDGKVRKMVNEKNALRHTYERRDEIDSYLSVDVDEHEVARLYKKIRETEQMIADTQVQLDAESRKRSSYNGAAITVNTEFNRFVETLLKEMELNDDSERIFKYSQMAIRILDEYKILLQSRKISVVADTMTSCYKKLANKKYLVDHISINPETLDISYINREGREIPRESLSAGEKQLMVISLLWALAKCSRKKLPVIIDTPLSRLDSQHRISIIKNYFPYASEQTIILSTDSEIDKYYYDILKDNVSDEFTLVYNEESQSTSIKRGYFMEAGNDN